MFVRVKEVRGRRYAYLVEGMRDGARVRQRGVCYLGPVSRAALGVPRKLFGAYTTSRSSRRHERTLGLRGSSEKQDKHTTPMFSTWRTSSQAFAQEED
jgi:hypothetical protein